LRGRYRAEFVGTGNALVTTRGATAPTDVVAHPAARRSCRAAPTRSRCGSTSACADHQLARELSRTEREGAVGETEGVPRPPVAELRAM
jgi:hypothetical protein